MKREVKTAFYTYKGKESSFHFYTDISMVDKVRFLNYITDSIVDENYYSMMRDMIFDFAIVDFFTDADVETIKDSPDVINHIETFLDETNIVAIVKENVRDGLLENSMKPLMKTFGTAQVFPRMTSPKN